MTATEIIAPLSFLADLPRYKKEKPFYALLRAPSNSNDRVTTHGDTKAADRNHNLEFDLNQVPLTNIRGLEDEYQLEQCGFEIMNQPTAFGEDLMTSSDAIKGYRIETETILKQRFGAMYVGCFECRVS